MMYVNNDNVDKAEGTQVAIHAQGELLGALKNDIELYMDFVEDFNYTKACIQSQRVIERLDNVELLMKSYFLKLLSPNNIQNNVTDTTV